MSWLSKLLPKRVVITITADQIREALSETTSEHVAQQIEDAVGLLQFLAPNGLKITVKL